MHESLPCQTEKAKESKSRNDRSMGIVVLMDIKKCVRGTKNSLEPPKKLAYSSSHSYIMSLAYYPKELCDSVKLFTIAAKRPELAENGCFKT